MRLGRIEDSSFRSIVVSGVGGFVFFRGERGRSEYLVYGFGKRRGSGGERCKVYGRSRELFLFRVFLSRFRVGCGVLSWRKCVRWGLVSIGERFYEGIFLYRAVVFNSSS